MCKINAKLLTSCHHKTIMSMILKNDFLFWEIDFF